MGKLSGGQRSPIGGDSGRNRGITAEETTTFQETLQRAPCTVSATVWTGLFPVGDGFPSVRRGILKAKVRRPKSGDAEQGNDVSKRSQTATRWRQSVNTGTTPTTGPESPAVKGGPPELRNTSPNYQTLRSWRCTNRRVCHRSPPYDQSNRNILPGLPLRITC